MEVLKLFESDCARRIPNVLMLYYYYCYRIASARFHFVHYRCIWVSACMHFTWAKPRFMSYLTERIIFRFQSPSVWHSHSLQIAQRTFCYFYFQFAVNVSLHSTQHTHGFVNGRANIRRPIGISAQACEYCSKHCMHLKHERHAQ